eukprot:jgi/Botrbrau1/2359/Bobra.39_1s0043.1
MLNSLGPDRIVPSVPQRCTAAAGLRHQVKGVRIPDGDQWFEPADATFSIAEVPIGPFVDRLYGSSKLGGAEIAMFIKGTPLVAPHDLACTQAVKSLRGGDFKYVCTRCTCLT